MDFDNKWISDYEKKDETYNNFYKEPVKIIQIYFMYLNSDREIYNIKTDKEYIDNNELTSERQLYLIKKHQNNMGKKHRLIGMLDYKVIINSDEIDDIINYKKYVGELNSIKYINAIKFKDTISLLQDINSVYFIFSNTIDDINESEEQYIKKNKNSSTRRIVLTTEKHKKTKRK